MSEDTFDQSQYTTFDFDWTDIEDDFQWVAVDGRGSCYMFTHKPKWNQYENQWLHNYDPSRHLRARSGDMQAGGPQYLMKRGAVAKQQVLVQTPPACKHAKLMLQYAQDAMVNEKPWELWEYLGPYGKHWKPLGTHPCWGEPSQYRRKPQFVQIEVPVQHKEAVEAYIKQLEKSNG